MPVRDAAMKVTGQMRYVADMKLPGMLYAKILFSPVPHARIKSIDTTQAQALGGSMPWSAIRILPRTVTMETVRIGHQSLRAGV